MRKTLVAGLLLLGTFACPTWAAPPPDPALQGENGFWADITVQGPALLKVRARGKSFNLVCLATSNPEEFLVRKDMPEFVHLASLFGGRLQWDQDEERLVCQCRGVTRTLKLGSRRVEGPSNLPGEREAELPLEAQIIDDQVYVPLSALEEFVDARLTVRPNNLLYVEPLIRSVRFEGSARKPKLIVETTAPVHYKAFTLKNPDRYVIDIPGAVLDTPNLTVQHPDLGNVRLGQFELGPAVSRIVVPMGVGVKMRPESFGSTSVLSWYMELPKMPAPAAGPVAVDDIHLEQTDKGRRLVVSANDPLRYEWQRLPDGRWLMDIPGALLKNPKEQEIELDGPVPGRIRYSQNQPEPAPVVRVVVDLEKPVEITTSNGVNENQLVIDILDKDVGLSAAVPKGRGSTAQSAVTGSGLIVLDPGHGGSDPGAINKSLGVTEAQVTLDICKRLYEILKAQGWNVVMTRTQDVDLTYAGSSASAELGARVKVANDARADLFISIHCNSSVSPNSNGTSIHYYKQSDYVLASELQAPLLSCTGRPNRGVQPNRFYVLVHSRMPAVLVETAFLSNPTEGQLLSDPAFRQKIAEGLAQGLRSYASRQLNWGTASK